MTGPDSIHAKVNDARKHIEKLGSNALTRLVAWELTRLSSADAIALADEILQIPIPAVIRYPVIDPFICPRHRKRFTLIERTLNGKRTCPNGEQWIIVGGNYEEC